MLALAMLLLRTGARFLWRPRMPRTGPTISTSMPRSRSASAAAGSSPRRKRETIDTRGSHGGLGRGQAGQRHRGPPALASSPEITCKTCISDDLEAIALHPQARESKCPTNDRIDPLSFPARIFGLNVKARSMALSLRSSGARARSVGAATAAQQLPRRTAPGCQVPARL